MRRIEDIISNYHNYSGGQDTTSIQKAYITASRILSNQGKNNSKYLNQVLESAFLLTELSLDIQSIVGAILSGVIEEELISTQEIDDLLGKEIALIAEGLLKINTVSSHIKEEERVAENIRQLIFATSKDVRVVFVKLTDRLALMRYITIHDKLKRSTIAQETLEIYAPIAHRLGLNKIKNELENLCFKELNPKKYDEVVQFCKECREIQFDFLNQMHQEVTDLLKRNLIKAEINERTKHFFSIFNKLKSNNLEYKDIHDLIAARILVENKANCYKVLGLIHETYQPISGRFKDYISLPKANGYQSLHTTVMTASGFTFEVQIRTFEMHEIAEKGIGAHYAYKQELTSKEQEDENMKWLRELTEKLMTISDPKESLELFNQELYSNSIYVFTPKGKIIKLPVGATLVDFAYSIHTEIGHQCLGGKIDGKQGSIKSVLENGQKIEIITSSQQKPKSDWLHCAITSKALSNIRHSLREQSLVDAEKLGRELFVKTLKRFKKRADLFEKSKAFEDFYKKVGYGTKKEFFLALGFDKENTENLTKYFQDSKVNWFLLKKKFVYLFQSKIDEPKILGVEDIPTRLANCCKPVKGDPIIGINTNGRLVSIHHKNCNHGKITQINPTRIMELTWINEFPEQLPIVIHYEYATNIKTSLSIFKILASEKAKLIKNSSRISGQKTKQEIMIHIPDQGQLDRILRKSNSLSGLNVSRKK